jgi:hypothetical protein
VLSFRSVNFRGDNYCLDIVKGLHEPAEVRGADITVPGMEGQMAGNRKHHVREVLIEGFIRGVGSTVAEKQESFHTTTATIMATLDRALAEGVLSVNGGDYGLPDGETWTLNARCADAIGSDMQASWTFQTWSIKLFSLDTEWESA